MTIYLNIAITNGDSVRLLENRLNGEIHLRYAFTDHLDSNGGETDAHGNITSREEYYSFGGSAGADEEAAEISDRTRRYSGKERDATGLLYYGWRYYQPGAGRWLSADPGGLVDGANLFRFCRNNPTSLRDADGRVPEPAEIARLAAWFSAQPRDVLNWRLMAGWQTAPLPDVCNYVGLAWNLLTDVEAGNSAATELYEGLRTAQSLTLSASATSQELALFDNPPPPPIPPEELASLDPSTPSLPPTRSAPNAAHRYVCKICEKTFTYKTSLRRHELNHSGAKPYPCSYCGKAFSQRSNLSTHIRIHTGEQRYKCRACEKSFLNSGRLATHARTHSGEKPYACTTCKKAFAQKSNLRSHMNLHSKVKPYPCTICQLKFAHRYTLLKHMRTHTGDRPYVCEICGKSFSQLSNLTRHMRRFRHQ